MSTKEVGVEWEWKISPEECFAGAYSRCVEAILEQCADNARALAPDAIQSMVSQRALTEVNVGSVDDANLWDLVLDLIETVPATTGEDGEPTLQQPIVPPAIFQKMQVISMTGSGRAD